MQRFVNKGDLAWVGLSALLCAAASLAWRAEPALIDWQPGLAFSQPWRAFSAAALHYSALHLAANLTGLAVVATLGVVARVPVCMALAWAVAWPLTQFGLLFEPGLAHFGGLSGVLHAGVAVVATHLLLAGTGARRLIGAALLAGLAMKVLGESPWGAALRHPTGWDIAVAPFAHASGAVAGWACATLAHGLAKGSARLHVSSRARLNSRPVSHR